jgi:hypothetical protein
LATPLVFYNDMTCLIFQYDDGLMITRWIFAH